MIDNLDRSNFIFSKKQLIISQSGITEFYRIHLKNLIIDDSFQITMQIKAIIPQNDPDQAELLPGKAATNVQIYPDKIQFSKKRSFAQISISILNETD